MPLTPRFVLHILFLFCYLPVVLSPGTRLSLTEKHFRIAAAAFDRNDLEEALREYRSALFYGGETAEILNNTGAVYLAMGKAGQALPWFEKAKKKDPASLPVRINMGIAYHELQRWADLLRETDLVLAGGTEEGWVFFGRGVALYHLGRYAPARRALELSLTKAIPSGKNDYSSEARRLLRKMKFLLRETGGF